MTESFSGFISIEDENEAKVSLTPHIHKPIEQTNVEDPRICMVREYLSKCPGATLKDIKNKALLHFEKTSEELKEIIKSANIEKYNEFYPQIDTPSIPLPDKKSKYITKEEIEFLEQYRDSDYKRTELYDEYKAAFPNSTRKIQFLSDYYFSHTIKQPVVKHMRNPLQPATNHHILAKAITALYKSGKSPKIFSEIKPIIELINDPNEVDFAIECLTS